MKRPTLREAIRRVEEEWCETAATEPAPPERMRALYETLGALPESALRRFTEGLFGRPTVTKNEDGTYTYTWGAEET